MDKKVILISIDGMRPDGLQTCGNSYVKELEKLCSYTYEGSSVFPSITLPCHYSMTHSIPPQRHGIMANTYMPQVHPVNGLFERIKMFGGISGMFFGWEPLRDIGAPLSLKFATYANAYMYESGDTYLTDEALKLIANKKPDFVFLYMVETDEKGGHDNGWMSEEYLRRISIAIDNVKRVIENCGQEYSVVIMADHGGHERSHGTNMPEDMKIPFFYYGPDFTPGAKLPETSLLDIAPTICDIMKIGSEPEWEGRSLINR